MFVPSFVSKDHEAASFSAVNEGGVWTSLTSVRHSVRTFRLATLDPLAGILNAASFSSLVPPRLHIFTTPLCLLSWSKFNLDGCSASNDECYYGEKFHFCFCFYFLIFRIAPFKYCCNLLPVRFLVKSHFNFIWKPL